MAKLKNISLVQLQTLGKLVTFTSCRGKPYARIRQPKLGKSKSPAKIYGQQKFTRAGAMFKYSRESIRSLYRNWTAASYLTLRDDYYSTVLSAWRQTNQQPVVLSDQAIKIVGTNLHLTPTFANHHMLPPEGYGTSPYGSTPYGSPLQFFTPAGAQALPTFKIAYTPPRTKPRFTTNANVKLQLACMKPPRAGVPKVDPTTTVTNPEFSISFDTWTSYFRSAQDSSQPLCWLACELAWAAFQLASWTPDETNPWPELHHYSAPLPGPLSLAGFIELKSLWTYNFKTVEEKHWPYISDFTFNYDYQLIQDPIPPWGLTVVFDGNTYRLPTTQNSITLPKPAAFSPTLALQFQGNDLQPPIACPAPKESQVIYQPKTIRINWVHPNPYQTYVSHSIPADDYAVVLYSEDPFQPVATRPVNRNEIGG